MIKNTLIALVTATALLGAAAPAMAGAFGDGAPEARDDTAAYILTSLQHKGVDATSVEEWGDLVRAYVTQADGTESMQLFTPTLLQPVAL
ncbi:MAG: hypothetical protein ACOH2N_11895 [Devosia sp.]